jgi:hypothetical protein
VCTKYFEKVKTEALHDSSNKFINHHQIILFPVCSTKDITGSGNTSSSTFEAAIIDVMDMLLYCQILRYIESSTSNEVSNLHQIEALNDGLVATHLICILYSSPHETFPEVAITTQTGLRLWFLS